MKIFLSWSGERSKQVAEGLKEWLILLFPTLDVWISSEDIKAGDRWAQEVAARLSETSFGIICMTKENIASPWLLYEAGALSKSMDAGRIVPYLIDMDYPDLPGPLSHFQAVKSDYVGTRKLIQTISSVLPNNRRNDEAIDRIFGLAWPAYEDQLTASVSVRATKNSNPIPTVRFLKAEGLIVEINGVRVGLTEREYPFYLFLAKRSADGSASFPYYKAAVSEFEDWITHFAKRLPPETERHWRHELKSGWPDKTMSSVLSGLRKKFEKAGLQSLEHLLPEKGRIGIRVNLESDLFDHVEPV